MGLPLPLLNLRRRLAGGISPAALFLNSEPGVWYDPSDLTTMFQDRAGTTPVTATGQTVGLVLDKRLGLTPGPELVTNGGFDADTAWTKIQATTTISGGSLNLISPNATGDVATQTISGLTSGIGYRVAFSVLNRSAGSFKFIVRNAANTAAVAETTVGADGSYTLFFIATGTSHFLRLQAGNTNTVLSVDNISVREIPGNHMVATADSSRGTYGVEPFGGRRNLLTFTEQFENAAWIKSEVTATANSAIAPDGTLTADTMVESTATSVRNFRNNLTPITSGASYSFSVYAKRAAGTRNIFVRHHATPANFQGAIFDLATGAISNIGTGITANATNVGNGWYRCSISFVANGTGQNAYVDLLDGTTSNYTGDGTSGIFLWGAQLELGSTATPYQRVTTAFDVTEAGVPTVHYVQFDGADDGYLTSTITPGTDKVQVFAGVRKLSDATLGAIVEHSTNSATSDGALALLASAASNPNYVFRSRGTTSTDATAPSSYVAPITNVITGLGDISGDRSTIRVNGSQVAQNVNDQGTGNYLAYPLYIGRRGGSSLPFNGRLYQLVARFGPNIDAARIAQVERFINSKTGAY